MEKTIFSIKSILSFVMISIGFASTINATTAQASDDSPITFRAFARTYSPNHCSYYSNIEAEVYLQTTQDKLIGELVASAEVHESYARNNPNAWHRMDKPLEFKAYLTRERNYHYMVKRNFTVNARGSFNYDKMRFRVERRDDDAVYLLPSVDSRKFYVIDLSGLNPSCDPHDDNFVELPVLVQCMNIEGYEPCEAGAE